MVCGQEPVPAVSARLGSASAALIVTVFLLAQVGQMRAAPAAEAARLAIAIPAEMLAPAPPVTEPARPEPLPTPVRLALLVEPEEAALAEPEPPPLAPPTYDVLLPVAGVTADELADTFDAPRSGGRTHRALDVLAPTGTPVLAAVDGHIIRTHESELGGLTVYQVGPDSAWVYYYAHLDAYAEGLAAGQPVAQGDTLGFVGMTGNAPVPHLHFAVWKARPGSRRLWGGRALNPYALFTR